MSGTDTSLADYDKSKPTKLTKPDKGKLGLSRK